MKLPKLIRPSSPLKQLRLERSTCPECPEGDGWIIWLTANKDFSLGTYLFLSDSGDIKRITIHADGGVSELDLNDGDRI